MKEKIYLVTDLKTGRSRIQTKKGKNHFDISDPSVLKQITKALNMMA